MVSRSTMLSICYTVCGSSRSFPPIHRSDNRHMARLISHIYPRRVGSLPISLSGQMWVAFLFCRSLTLVCLFGGPPPLANPRWRCPPQRGRMITAKVLNDNNDITGPRPCAHGMLNPQCPTERYTASLPPNQGWQKNMQRIDIC